MGQRRKNEEETVGVWRMMGVSCIESFFLLATLALLCHNGPTVI